MGKVILPLSEGELSEKTIFDKRFVIECCETFHLHWRNLRLELSADNWLQLVDAFETGIAKWRAHGSPRSHPHLELARFLMDTSEIVHPTTANAELCENLYKTLRETHGADAEFWVEDAFVHFHYRDLRVEMPIADFLAFSKTMSEAHTKLRSHTFRPIEDLFRQLDEENIVYVVLRNWEALPGERRRRPALRPRPARPPAPRRAGRPALARRAHPRRGLPRAAQGAGARPGRGAELHPRRRPLDRRRLHARGLVPSPPEPARAAQDVPRPRASRLLRVAALSRGRAQGRDDARLRPPPGRPGRGRRRRHRPRPYRRLP